MKNGAIWEYETYCLDGVSRVSFELPTHDLSILVKSDLWQKLLDFLGCAQSEDLRMSQQEKTAFERRKSLKKKTIKERIRFFLEDWSVPIISGVVGGVIGMIIVRAIAG